MSDGDSLREGGSYDSMLSHLMADVCEKGLTCSYALSCGYSFIERKMCRMLAVAESVDDEETEVSKFVIFALGDEGAVGEVCHRTDAIAEDGEVAVHEADRDNRLALQGER